MTPFGAARLLGFDPPVSYLVQAFVTSSMVLAVGLVWRRRPNQNRRATTLPFSDSVGGAFGAAVR